MPGKRITDIQYEVYMKNKNLAFNQEVAAAKAGFSERSGRNLEKLGCKPSQRPKKKWRTRKDPLEGVWNEVLVPLLEKSPYLNCRTLLEYIQDEYPGQYPDSVLRTLQKRAQQWKGIHGKEKEIIFRQIHTPGRQGLSDFTNLKGVEITIQDKIFNHMLYHFRLAYSNWSYMKIVHGGESFTALATGLQDALWKLGGVPCEHRTDSLSAAFKNLTKAESEDITRNYESLCGHYGMTATRNNRGKGHENGSIESAHGHLKRRIEQALMLRGSYNFDSASEYQDFISKIVTRYNITHHEQISIERAVLKALPQFRTVDFTEVIVRVTTSSTISVKKVVYSVPSKLIGRQLRVRVYDERLSCYLNADHVLDLARVRVTKGMTTVKDEKIRCINYRHLIHSLVCKPGAFRYSVLKDDILPNDTYKKIWEMIDEHCTKQHAGKLMVGILKIAADYDCELKLGEQIFAMLEKRQVPCLGTLDNMYKFMSTSTTPTPISTITSEGIITVHDALQTVPLVSTKQHSLRSYNELLMFTATSIAPSNVEVCNEQY